MTGISSTEVDGLRDDSPPTDGEDQVLSDSVKIQPGVQSLARKLDHLFRTVHPAGRSEYSYQEVANAVRDAHGAVISHTYIWQLRKGQRDNPTKRHLEALAGFFGVPVSYFFDDEAVVKEIESQLALLAALRDTKVRHVALRAAGLSSESLTSITAVIEQIRQLEGLTNSKHS